MPESAVSTPARMVSAKVTDNRGDRCGLIETLLFPKSRPGVYVLYREKRARYTIIPRIIALVVRTQPSNPAATVPTPVGSRRAVSIG